MSYKPVQSPDEQSVLYWQGAPSTSQVLSPYSKVCLSVCVAEIIWTLKHNNNRNKNRRLEDQRMQNYTLGGTHVMGKLKFDWMSSYAKASEERLNERYAEYESEYIINNDNDKTGWFSQGRYPSCLGRSVPIADSCYRDWWGNRWFATFRSGRVYYSTDGFGKNIKIVMRRASWLIRNKTIL